ncbi:Branched-chain-amino-acid aminotransferase 3, chloroplastic [Morella rubra]|uniref:Branched-chain-amino-acid aminotransferase 3, chloroplastic n=1 Tax=Morella rubra TaxID=262757 RepID=A0A6A1UNX4_9ROSI|nr:Branched-chain-amino-acid aminotransferase 3, chloroplastic [Morella rubra]
MERSAALARLQPNYLLCPSRRNFPPSLPSLPFADRPLSSPFSLKLQKQFPHASLSGHHAGSPFRRDAVLSETYSETSELTDIDWDNLGFAFLPTDYMYIMKCARDGNFSKGELQRFGNIEMSPSAGVLNYGQWCFV